MTRGISGLSLHTHSYNLSSPPPTQESENPHHSDQVEITQFITIADDNNFWNEIGINNPDAQTSITGQQAINVLSQHVENLDSLIQENIHRCPEVAGSMQQAVEAAIRGTTQPPTIDFAARSMFSGLSKYFKECRASTPLDRAHATINYLYNCLQACARNDFKDKKYCWAANLFNATLQVGLTTAIATVARELIGFAIAEATEEQSMTVKQVMGMTCLLLGIGLNIAGLTKDLKQGSATWKSAISRAGMISLSGAALLLSYLVKSEDGSQNALSTIGSVAVSTALYTLTRDLSTLFSSLSQNTNTRCFTPINWQTTLVGSTLYSLLQFSNFEITDRWFPNSGATASHLSFSHVFMKTLINALIEVTDELVRRTVAHHTLDPINPNDPVETLHIRIKQACPTSSDFWDKLFRTAAFRTAAFETLVATSAIVGVALENNSLTAEERHLAVSTTLSLSLFFIYGQFMYVHDKRPPKARTDLLPSLPDSVRQARILATAPSEETRL